MVEMEKLVSDQDMIMKADLEALIINITSAIEDFNIIKNNQEIIQSDKIEELNTLVEDLNYLININLMNVSKFTNEFKIINDKLIELNNKLNVTEKSITNYYSLTTKLSGDINTFYPVIFNIFNKEGSVFIERNNDLDVDIFPYNTPLLSTEIHYSHNSDYPMFFNIERNIQRYKKTIRLISDRVFSATQENINDLSLWKFYPEINNTENPADILVDVKGGSVHTVGLKEDGTCIAVGNNTYYQCNVSSWTNIKQIACGSAFTIGLKEDGTVVATGNNNKNQCNISSWTDIVKIACGSDITLGIKSDGSVVYTGTIYGIGDNSLELDNLASWENIIDIDAGNNHVIGLKSDGTCVSAQADTNDFGQSNVSGWSNVKQISCGSNFTIGLKEDGTCYFTGKNFYYIEQALQYTASNGMKISYGLCGYNHVLGILDDGSILAIGNNEYNQCSNVDTWTDIKKIGISYNGSIGIKNDGSVIYTGRNIYNEGNVSNWQLFQDPSTITEYYSSFYIRGGLTYTFRTTDEFVLEDIQNSINRIGTNNAEYNFLSDYIVKELNEDDVAYINNDELYKEHKRYGHYSVGPYYFEQRFDKFIPKYITSIKPVIYEPTEGSVITTPTIEVLASRPDFLDIGDSISEIQIVEGIDLDFSEIKTTILTDADFIIDGNGNISFTFESSLGSNEANLYFVVRYKGVNYGVTEYSDITQVTCSFIIPTELAKPEVIRFEKAWEARGVNIIITPPEYVHGDGIVTEVYLEYDNNNTGNPLYHSYIALNTLTFTDGEYCIDMADYSFEWSSANNVSARIKYTDNNNVESPWSDVLTTLIIG